MSNNLSPHSEADVITDPKSEVVAFTQNQRNEVRDLKDLSGAIMANPGMKGQTYIAIENHANDSRIKLKYDDICQTLSSRMGTGGNNEPMVLEILTELDGEYIIQES